MSNELVFQGSGAALPAHLQQYQQQAHSAAELVTGFGSLPKISIKGKQFRYEKDGVDVVLPAGNLLEVVILASDPPKGCAKSFYDKAYSNGADELPDCFSSDGITPDDFVDKPKSRSCAECPLNAFGSGKDQAGNPTKGKACGDHKNLFLVLADDIGGAIYNLRVPATSLKGLSQFGRLLSKHGVGPQLVVTSLGFTNEVHPQLEFNCTRYLDEVEAPAAIARADSDELEMALPSKNKAPVDEAKVQTVEVLEHKPAHIESEVPAIPQAPVAEPVKVMTDKAGGATYDQFINNGWTEQQMIDNGYLEIK
jgi:hypothetical protein